MHWCEYEELLIWYIVVGEELFYLEQPSMWIIPVKAWHVYFDRPDMGLLWPSIFVKSAWFCSKLPLSSVTWDSFCCCVFHYTSNWVNLLLKSFNTMAIEDICSFVLARCILYSSNVLETFLVWCSLIIIFLLYLLLVYLHILCFFFKNYLPLALRV